MNYEEKIGDVIEKTKHIEYILNCIIGNFVSPKEVGFFDNIILNSSIIPIGVKVKIIKTICKIHNEDYNLDNLHKLINLRNLFAHESSYVDSYDQGMLVKINELKNDGSYNEKEFEETYKRFLKIYLEVKKGIIKLNEKLTKIEGKNEHN